MKHYQLSPLPGFQHTELEETTSTNDWAHEHLAELQCPLSLVTAEFQTAGRGATGGWQSRRGENLMFSLVSHPAQLPATQMFRLSVAICISVCNALNEVSPGFCIKWPNDVYHGDRKVVGILIENELQGKFVSTCIMGVGVNVNQTTFSPDAPNPTSLALITGKPVDRSAVLQRIIDNFHRLLTVVQRPDLWPGVFDEYHRLLYRRSGFRAFTDEKGTFEAEIVEVEPAGHLVLRDRDGQIRRYAFKEVSYII